MTYDPTNIFARIIRKEIPCNEIYRDNKVLAFYDRAPAARVHALVIPIGEYVSFDDFVTQAPAEDIVYFFNKVQAIAHQLGMVSGGYRLISNHGKYASQMVPHFHMHLLGGEMLGGLVGSTTHSVA